MKILYLLIASVLCSSLIRGQECSLSEDIALTQDGTLVLRQVINTVDGTVSVEVEYFGTAWVGIAFSDDMTMIGSTAIIGLPDAGTVQKYDLTIQDISGVLPSSADRQTLTDFSIFQDGTSTILSFTKLLEETGEPTVVAGSNIILVAYGMDNTLAYHDFRLPTTAEFTVCAAAATPTSAPVTAPVAVPVAEPVAAPVAVPVAAPLEEPVAVPAATPTATPVMAPTGAGGDAEPSFSPTVSETEPVPGGDVSDAPTGSPNMEVEAPTVGGYTPTAVMTPVAAPTNATAPVKAPVKAPVATSAGVVLPFMSSGWMMAGVVVGASLLFTV